MKDDEFVRFFDNRVKETISKFKLFDKKEKIMVAASGGKDSTVLLYVMKKLGYNVEAITINAHIGCYSDESLENLKKFCSDEEIKLFEISLKKEFGCSLCYIMSVMEGKGMNKTSCSICGSLRRYLLNKYSKKLNSKILLTGHNLDDEANGTLMTLFAGNLNQVARIGPVTVDLGDIFVKRAKPLYFLFEDEVERYSKIMKFQVHYGWCPCSVAGARRFYAEMNISPEEKFNLVKNMVANLDKLREYYKGSKKLKICKNCKQPSSNELCQACTIISVIESPEVEKMKLDKNMAVVQKCEVLVK